MLFGISEDCEFRAIRFPLNIDEFLDFSVDDNLLMRDKIGSSNVSSVEYLDTELSLFFKSELIHHSQKAPIWMEEKLEIL
jgi:hypothetical protein